PILTITKKINIVVNVLVAPIVIFLTIGLGLLNLAGCRLSIAASPPCRKDESNRGEYEDTNNDHSCFSGPAGNRCQCSTGSLMPLSIIHLRPVQVAVEVKPLPVAHTNSPCHGLCLSASTHPMLT